MIMHAGTRAVVWCQGKERQAPVVEQLRTRGSLPAQSEEGVPSMYPHPLSETKALCYCEDFQLWCA
jgi:hypothetical protein